MTRPITTDQFNAALQRAASDVINLADDDVHDGEQVIDAVNLVVNAALHYLDHADATLNDVIAANYSDSAEEVRSWIQGG